MSALPNALRTPIARMGTNVTTVGGVWRLRCARRITTVLDSTRCATFQHMTTASTVAPRITAITLLRKVRMFLSYNFFHKLFPLGPTSGCCPGCSTDENCPDTHPICGHGGSSHLCGCTADKDCKAGFICDTSDLDGNGDDKECIPDGCYQTDDRCDGWDEVCHIPAHDNCFWCDGMECKPGRQILTPFSPQAVSKTPTAPSFSPFVVTMDTLTCVVVKLTTTALWVSSAMGTMVVSRAAGMMQLAVTVL